MGFMHFWLRLRQARPEVIKLSYSTQLSMKFILLINVEMPTIVGILTFISRLNKTSECFKQDKNVVFHYFISLTN